MEMLHNILINTYNSDKALRTAAEQALEQFLVTPGALSLLLSYSANIEVPRELRQASSIIVKNKIRAFWSDEGTKFPPLSPAEKQSCHAILLDAMFKETDSSIRGLIAESIRTVSEFDFPEKWPELLPEILSNIQSPEVLRVFNALTALRKVVKRLEFKRIENRQSLNGIIRTAFPLMLTLIRNIKGLNTIEVAQVLKMCFKIFFSATIYKLPVPETDGHIIDYNGWFEVISEMLDKRLPEASEGVEPLGQPTNPEERTAWPWWKMKKWAARILNNFIQRYGNPKFTEEAYVEFAKHFKNESSKALLAPVMNALSAKARGEFLTVSVHRDCLSYLNSCVELAPTYKMIKPYMEFILFQVILPTITLTSEEVELFEDDPSEFTRKVYSPFDEWMDPRVAASNLLTMLVRYREKDVLPKLLPYIQAVAVEYQSSVGAGAGTTTTSNLLVLKKDGALSALHSIFDILIDHKTYSPLLEQFMSSFVIPDMQPTTNPILRTRACWMMDKFTSIEWKDSSVVQFVTRGLISGLRDPSLPVQTASACSLQTVMEADGADDLLRPFLKEIVGEYFRIMEEMESDVVISALQSLVLKFGNELAPVAFPMVEKLLLVFQQFASGQGTEDEDEAAMSATQCLDTISAVLETLEEKPELHNSIESLILPMLMKYLGTGEDCMEYLDNFLDILGYLTYWGDVISPGVWSLCGHILVAMNSWAIDYLQELSTPLLNYMSKDMQSFLSLSHTENGKPLATMLLENCQKIFETDAASSADTELDSRVCGAMLTCFVTSSKPFQSTVSISHALPQILNLLLTRLAAHRTKRLRLRCVEGLLACIYYDPILTFQVLSSSTTTSTLPFNAYELIFQNLAALDSDMGHRLVVLAFTTALTLPVGSLPEAVRGNLQPMFQQIIRELVLIEEEDAKNGLEEEDGDGDDDDAFEDAEEDEDDDDEGDENESMTLTGRKLKALEIPEGGYDEDEDCVNVEDEAYRKTLEKLSKEERVKRELYRAGELVEEDDEDDEDMVFTSVVQTMDVTQFFFRNLEVASGAQPEVIAALRGGLSADDNERMAKLFSDASSRPAK